MRPEDLRAGMIVYAEPNLADVVDGSEPLTVPHAVLKIGGGLFCIDLEHRRKLPADQIMVEIPCWRCDQQNLHRTPAEAMAAAVKHEKAEMTKLAELIAFGEAKLAEMRRR